MLEALLVWIVVGGIAGWLASVVVQGGGMGLLMYILVGIVGAVIGSILLSALFGLSVTGFNLTSVLVAFVGAVVVLLIMRALHHGGYTRRFYRRRL